METLDFAKLLSFGAIGLGCILAVLTYFLLKGEQEQPKPRKQMLTACNVFMGFSLILIGFGFISELWRDSAARDGRLASEKVVQLESELELAEGSLADFQQQSGQCKQELTRAEQELTTIRTRLKDLIDLKSGKVARLAEQNPDSPSFKALVIEIQRDLADIDTKLAEVIQPPE